MGCTLPRKLQSGFAVALSRGCGGVLSGQWAVVDWSWRPPDCPHQPAKQESVLCCPASSRLEERDMWQVYFWAVLWESGLRKAGAEWRQTFDVEERQAE